MDVVLVCDLSELSTKWLEDIHKYINKSKAQLKLTIDYISNKLKINIVDGKMEEPIYIKCYSYNDIPDAIKKLNL